MKEIGNLIIRPIKAEIDMKVTLFEKIDPYLIFRIDEKESLKS